MENNNILKTLACEKVFEWSSDGIIILDGICTIIDFNASAIKIVTSLSSKSIGQNIIEHLKDYKELVDCITNFKESQFQVQNGDKCCYYSVKCSKILDNKGCVTGHLVFIHDITVHISTMENLYYITQMDELTGIFNRRHFTELGQYELSRAKRYSYPLSFIIVDLDFFKTVNDKFGHLAGDEALKKISIICRDTIRSTDLLGRFGGEEFIILMPQTRIEDAEILAKRLCKNIEASEITYNGNNLNVTVSIGVAGSNSVKDEDLNTFLKQSDQALYIAKSDEWDSIKNVRS